MRRTALGLALALTVTLTACLVGASAGTAAAGALPEQTTAETTTVAKRALGPIGRALARAAARRSAAAAGTVKLPVGDRPGWRQVLAEDFAGTTLPEGWGRYSGHPGGEPDGWWDPSHVVVRDGALRLEGYVDDGRWTTGGVMATATPTTYGKYEVRFRMTPGVGVKYAILLWPKSNRWPVDGEIDFAEDGGGNRTSTSATLHYGVDNQQIQRKLTGQDFSRWQTVGVEWTPGKIVYTLNGRPWSTVESPHVPSGPMRLAIQTETGTCGERWLGCPDATTPSRVDLEVDWVAIWQQQ